MPIERAPSDARAIVGRRFDWLSVAFRVRFVPGHIEYLEGRVEVAKKHGEAGVDLAGSSWRMKPPRTGTYFLDNENRGERLEIVLGAPGSFISSVGEVIPGWTLCVHTSGIVLADVPLPKAIRRAWGLARGCGEVFEARLRRVDVTSDWRGVPVTETSERLWHRLPRVGGAVDKEGPGDSHRPRNLNRPTVTLGQLPSEPHARPDARGPGPEAGRDRVPGVDPQLGLLPGRPKNRARVRKRR